MKHAFALVLLLLIASNALAADTNKSPAYPKPIAQKVTRDLDLKLFKIRVEADGRLTSKRKLSAAEEEYLTGMREATFGDYVFDVKPGGISGVSFALFCDAGASADPSCMLATPGNPEKSTSIPGLRFAIPGDGCLYASGHANSYFAERRKYCLTPAGALAEVSQPALYVGLKSKALKPVTLYAGRNLQTAVTTIAAKESLEVLLLQDDLYLVRDGFGLVGWAKLEAEQTAVDVDGLFFAGD
ncbi:hypothetical protein ACFSM5_21025 [Lacibacterium aquatile]|uniref:SH3 domain-containing protein n=1 Tax=Lacibacterium aquatile TaxID=1168082 RepID=A0ABW5DWP2_9PROT